MKGNIIKMYYDLETTGLDYERHAIHQIAGIIEVDDVVAEEFNIKLRPWEGALYDTKALEICRVTEEELRGYMPHKLARAKLLAILGNYVSRFKKDEKIHLVGFNNRGFDDGFLRDWFVRCNDHYFGSWFFPDTLDVIVLASEYLLDRRAGMPSFKLHRVATTLGLEVDKTKTHDALYDVTKTREVYQIVTGREIEL